MPAGLPLGTVVVRREIEGAEPPVEEWWALDVRIPPEDAADALRRAGWEVVDMWWNEIKKEALASSGFIKLDEGISTLGFYVKEPPEEEEREWQGTKRKQYIFKVAWIITPLGERIEFDEPKKFRASVRLAGAISAAIEKKVNELTGGVFDPEELPEVVPVKIRREGTGSMTRYSVVG